MTYLAGHLETKQNKHRLHPALSTICITFACIGTAIPAKAGLNVVGYKPGTSIIVASAQFDIGIHMPLVGPIESVLRGTDAEEIRLQISARPAVDKSGSDVSKIIMKVVTPFFVEFYEDNVSWLRANVGDKFTQWPSVWQFGRVVRNAASHNSVSINDQNFTPVSWYGLTYGPAQHGLHPVPKTPS